ncbi:MAG TPA: hypothetical protein V6C84_25845 [Coleofasciculaceae cyanobacterium]
MAVLSEAVDQTNDVFNSRDSWRSLTLTPASASYTATSSGFTYTVPVGKEWQFQSAYLPYNTDATVLSRVMRAYFGVSSGGFAGGAVSRVAQAASLNRIYNVGLYPRWMWQLIISMFICRCRRSSWPLAICLA